jgi:Putative Ig domain
MSKATDGVRDVPGNRGMCNPSDPGFFRTWPTAVESGHRRRDERESQATGARVAVMALAMTLALCGCRGGSTSDPMSSSAPPPPPPPPPAPIAITTTTLPYGRIGQGYSATLAASGGTSPYHWSLTGGSLPGGLALGVSSGALSGTPTATANHVSLVFQVSDSGATAQTASVTLTLTVSPADISVSVSPQRAGLTLGQTLGLAATTNDLAGVTWSVTPSGPSLAPAMSTSGQSITWSAPKAAGVYTVTATSVTDPTQSKSMPVAVTDLSGMLTYHDDLARDGANEQEYALTPADVNSSDFGKLFSCTVDGAIYAQPLWVANQKVNGAVRNVVLVATEHDSLYAFDADAIPCEQLWQVSLIDSSHGGTGGEVTVPAGTSGYLVGNGDGDLAPEVGVTGTPVIDPAAGVVYVVSKSMNAAGTSFYQRLHAVDITTGAEKPGSPVTIAASFPGTGDGGSTVAFDPQMENQRAALALVGGVVYIGWGSHEDTSPWYGWLVGYAYNGARFSQMGVLNAAPNERRGGIWMSGAAPAADSEGRLYVVTGNAGFDANSGSSPNDDYGDSLLELSSNLGVMQYFTPSDQSSDLLYNDDFGAGGAAVLVDLPSTSPVQHLVISGGKDGNLYVLDRDSLGGYGDGNSWQEISIGTEGNRSNSGPPPGVIWGVGAVWNDYYYLAGAGEPLVAYRLDASTAKLSLSATATVPSGGFGFPGSTPTVSASGNTNGVVWALDNSQYCTNGSLGCGPAVLHAYDASDVTQELWNSSRSSADQAGNAVKFVVPTVANGKIYVGTRGNNTGGTYGSTSASGELDVYGLKP